MAYGLERKKAMKKASELLKIFRLENKLDWFPANFSKGMKTKGDDRLRIHDGRKAFGRHE